MEHNKINIDELPEVYRTIAEICDFDTAIKIAKHFSGEQIYFPTYDKIQNTVRNKKIIDEFNGYNYKYLAKKYNLTESAIRKICTEEIQNKQNEEDADQYKLW